MFCDISQNILFTHALGNNSPESNFCFTVIYVMNVSEANFFNKIAKGTKVINKKTNIIKITIHAGFFDLLLRNLKTGYKVNAATTDARIGMIKGNIKYEAKTIIKRTRPSKTNFLISLESITPPLIFSLRNSYRGNYYYQNYKY